MPFVRGRSGNPKGRPHKSRALTELLERAGAEKMVVKGEDFVARRKVMAEHLWTAATEGEVELPGGEKLTFGPKEWLEVVRFLYQHIDGPAKPVQPEGSDDKTTKLKKLDYDEIANTEPAELARLYREKIG